MHQIKCMNHCNESVVSPWFISFVLYAQTVPLHSLPMPFILCMFYSHTHTAGFNLKPLEATLWRTSQNMVKTNVSS